MTTRKIADPIAEAVAALKQHGTYTAAARALGIARSTLTERIARAGVEVETGRTAAAARDPGKVDDVDLLRDQLRTLKAQLSAARKDTLSDEMVKREILKLAEAEPDPPEWLTRVPKKGHVTGVPVLLCSDWHAGEVVAAEAVGGTNSYDLAIFHRRVRTLVEVTIDLLKNRFANPSYPGLVMVLAGDLVSGDVLHEELEVSNEAPIMPVVVDLFGVLVWAISTLADEFGNILLPCVTGNHGRSTKKLRAKGRVHTSYEWLVYRLLQRHFESDKRVHFIVGDGPDVHFNVYSTRLVVTHGDSFKGGDGIVGHVLPVMRGNLKKRSRNMAVGQDHDLLLLGHFHRYTDLPDLTSNGSLIGPSEYSWNLNLPYEEPRQALFLIHPSRRGKTFSMPVYVERASNVNQSAPWASWPEGKQP